MNISQMNYTLDLYKAPTVDEANDALCYYQDKTGLIHQAWLTKEQRDKLDSLMKPLEDELTAVYKRHASIVTSFYETLKNV